MIQEGMITGRELFDLNWVESSDTWGFFESVEEAAAAYDAARRSRALSFLPRLLRRTDPCLIWLVA
jgi:hypothetical protein